MDCCDSFFSLPAKPTAVYAVPSKKTRPSFVHLTHSNSAPVMMAEAGTAGGLPENRNGGMETLGMCTCAVVFYSPRDVVCDCFFSFSLSSKKIETFIVRSLC